MGYHVKQFFIYLFIFLLLLFFFAQYNYSDELSSNLMVVEDRKTRFDKLRQKECFFTLDGKKHSPPPRPHILNIAFPNISFEVG